MLINSQSAEDTYHISTIMTKIFCIITGNNNKKVFKGKNATFISYILQLCTHGNIVKSGVHLCARALVCVGARARPYPALNSRSPLSSPRG